MYSQTLPPLPPEVLGIIADRLSPPSALSVSAVASTTQQALTQQRQAARQELGNRQLMERFWQYQYFKQLREAERGEGLALLPQAETATFPVLAETVRTLPSADGIPPSLYATREIVNDLTYLTGASFSASPVAAILSSAERERIGLAFLRAESALRTSPLAAVRRMVIVEIPSFLASFMHLTNEALQADGRTYYSYLALRLWWRLYVLRGGSLGDLPWEVPEAAKSSIGAFLDYLITLIVARYQGKRFVLTNPRVAERIGSVIQRDEDLLQANLLFRYGVEV